MTLVMQEQVRKRAAVMPDGCWIWEGQISNKGYGVYHRYFPEEGRQRYVSAHRLSYAAFRGPVPEGLVLDHFFCDQPLCVNPWHLKACTRWENTKRSKAPTAVNASKTHCNRGHEFSAENTSIGRNPSGARRQCRSCHRENQRAYRSRKALA